MTNKIKDFEKKKLKTLKDIEPCGTCCIEHSCYCSNKTKDESKHLPNCEIRSYCIFEDLKQEAIKWIKKLQKVSEKGDTSLKEHGKLTKDFEVNIFDYEQDDVIPIIDFIKYFFNLTEEDIEKELCDLK